MSVQAAPQQLASPASPAQLGSLGGANATPLSPPVALRLIATDIASGASLPLPDGALSQTYLVSLPVLAQPTDPTQTFA